MSKTTKLFITAGLVILAAACGAPEQDKLTSKKEELKKKESELSNLKTDIAKLKTEISELDTTARDNAIAVRVINVESGTYKNPFQVQGLVESEENIMISPEVPAKLLEIHVREGQYVNKGQLLASLDGSVASSQMAELEDALQLAKTNYEKQSRLWEKNIGSEMQYLQAKNTYERLQKSVQAASQQLGKYSLTSPISGTVDEIMANVGELVGSMGGGPVMRIVNLNNIKVTANVSEAYVGQIRTGQSVDIRFPSIDLTLHEKLQAVGNVINKDNRTFTVIVRPTSQLNKLKPNMLSFITAYDYVEEGVISIPTRLIRNDGQNHFIYTLASQGNKLIVEKRIVELGRQFPSHTIVTSGLKEGDQVISEGVNSVIVGDEVKIITAAG